MLAKWRPAAQAMFAFDARDFDDAAWLVLSGRTHKQPRQVRLALEWPLGGADTAGGDDNSDATESSNGGTQRGHGRPMPEPVQQGASEASSTSSQSDVPEASSSANSKGKKRVKPEPASHGAREADTTGSEDDGPGFDSWATEEPGECAVFPLNSDDAEVTDSEDDAPGPSNRAEKRAKRKTMMRAVAFDGDWTEALEFL